MAGLQAPQYGQGGGGGPRVSPSEVAPLRVNTEAPAEAFGGGAVAAEKSRSAQQIGAATNDVLDHAQRIGLELQDQADHTVVMDKNLAAEKLKDDLQAEAMGYHGPDAVKKQPELQDKLRTGLQALSADLSPRQQGFFDALATSHMSDFGHVLRSHGVEETKKWEKGVTDATVENFQVDAARNPFDPRRIQESKALALTEQQRYLEANGVHADTPDGKAVLDNANLDLTSKLHIGVIDARLNANKPQAAVNYFELNKDEIDPKYYQHLDGALKEGHVKVASQSIVDGLLKKYSTFAAARGEISTIQDPDTRDAVERRAEREYALNAKMAGEATDKNMLKWSDAVQKTGSIDAVPAMELAGMTGEQQKALHLLADQSAGIKQPVPDATVYAKYNGMLPGQLSRVTPSEMTTQVKPYLSPEQFKDVSDRWAASRDTVNPDSQAKVKGMYNDKQMAFNALQGVKIFSGGDTLTMLHKDPEKADIFREFSEKADAAFQTFAADNGKAPTVEQKQEILDKLLVKKVLVDRGIWHRNPEKPVAVLTDEEKGHTYVKLSTIPPAHIYNMEKRAATLGNTNLTTDQKQRAYAAALASDDARVDQILSGK